MSVGDFVKAGTDLVSGYMAQNAQENANATNQANWQTSMAYQHLANTNTIQWKVADAIKAGLHPLAALGVNTAGGPASFIGATPETGMANAVGGMGQSLQRALSASDTQQRRAESYDTAIRQLDIENKTLQNEMLRSRIAQTKAGTPPPLPDFNQRWGVPGQGDIPSVKLKPFEVSPGDSGAAYREPASHPNISYANTPGGYAIEPSKETQERIEDNWLAAAAWMYRNQFIPSVDKSSEQPPPVPAPDGYEWRWHALRQEYRPARRRGPWGLFKEWK